MANKEACDELAAFLRSAKYKFNMSKGYARPECGSAGCIGGHAAVLWPRVSDRDFAMSNLGAFSWCTSALMKKLEISYELHERLCYLTDTNLDDVHFVDAPEQDADLDAITRLGAAATVERLGLTGKVEWYKSEQIPDPDEEGKPCG